MTAQWFSEMINVFCCAAARETSPALANGAAAGRQSHGHSAQSGAASEKGLAAEREGVMRPRCAASAEHTGVICDFMLRFNHWFGESSH